MAMDKSEIRIDKARAPDNTDPIGFLNIRSDLSGVWVMVYNTSATDDLNIWPKYKGGNPLVVKAGTKRQIGFFENNTVLYYRSTTGSTIDIEVWSNPNKWDSSWFADESLTIAPYTPVIGCTGLTGDPTHVAGVPITIDFTAILPGGRNAKFVSLIPNVDVDIIVNIFGSGTAGLVRVLADESFTLGPDPNLEIISLTYVNVNFGEAFELRLISY
jgi:hypothetical protein